ncbi:MAG: helix-turn-helix transcriptional regulator [Hyphomonadaceae bacterium]
MAIADGDTEQHFATSDSARELDLTRLRQLRPSRVYAFDELDTAEDNSAQFGRVVRVDGPADWSAWLMIAREGSDFAAANSALLSALAPHVAVAAGNHIKMERMRARVAIIEDLLERTGIAWRTLDGAITSATWSATPLDTEALAAKAKQALREDAPIVRHSIGQDVLVAKSGLARAVMLMRVCREHRAQQVKCVARLWSLTPSEARFAVTLADGLSLSEAAEKLGLTLETARHYSKRIYAKTGARGLPDLVRMVITSVALLA